MTIRTAIVVIVTLFIIIIVVVVVLRGCQKQNPELTGCMSKKANFTLTILSIFTSFSSIP